MANGLAGRVAVVTRAAARLGQAYAARQAAAGATVVLADNADRNPPTDLITDAGGTAAFLRCDVTSEEDVARLHAETNRLFGACTILVNNAGISPNVDWDDMTFSTWRQVLAVNLDSMYLCSRAFVPDMRAARYGRIVNISSDTFGLVIPGFTAYMASKGGVIGLTRGLATDLGEDGITANAIMPGLTRTPRTEAQWAGTDLFDQLANSQAIKRIGLPADLAGVVSLLVSQDAGWLTGQTLAADGGLLRL